MRNSACLILAMLAFSHIASGRRNPYVRRPSPTIPQGCRCGLVQRSKSSMASHGHSINGEDYIINGRETEANEYPWQVFLDPVNGKSCGGSLISDEWVLTAGHCVDGNKTGLKVYLGSHGNSGTDGSLRVIPKDIIRHPGYVLRGKGYYTEYDFALIQLREPVDFRKHQNIRPICLPEPNGESYEGEMAITTGWGNINANSNRNQRLVRPEKLQDVDIKVISNSECAIKYWDFYRIRISEQMICAGVANKKSASFGDSGGPLIVKGNGQSYELIGITSFGQPSAPGVYARVTNQLRWIKKTIAKKGSLRTCPRKQ